ncbi:MAG: alanine racemase [Acidimicrobiia bacterium]|nr:alanine racemase [Acidimicrobiia bacterium]
MRTDTLPTPALLVDIDALEHNMAAMGERWPGRSLRPHVKAFKSTSLAAELAARGHDAFCCATLREMEGMVAAGLGSDLLLANETLDDARLGALVAGGGRITVAVDSDATLAVARRAGVREVLIDVNIGLPRCGCPPADAGRLADEARRAGLEVRGVMGYEGHVVGEVDRDTRVEQLERSLARLDEAHDAVGGEVVSGGGTGTWDINTSVTELQAGSFTLMDTAYARLDLPFHQALAVMATVISVHPDGFAVADAGLKALATDHGNPALEGHTVWFCSDEHLTFAPGEASPPVHVGDRVMVRPSHVDPTVALHEELVVVRGGFDAGDVVDRWPVDLRGW